MKDYAKEFQPDIEEFREATNAFYEKNLSVAAYKKISGGFGSYAQRGGESGMLRLRLTGGRITKEQLKFICDSIQTYKISRLHLTTCQTVQLHNLKADIICALIEDAWAHGIITRGGGGDYPRNVMMSPLSGVNPNETFDVSGYVEAAADYLLDQIHKVKLPRKLKVCFSNTQKDLPHATFRDLGFVAKKNHTFDVYSAGGLGPNPKMGVRVAEDVEPDMVLSYIKAMIDTFLAHGNYEQRAKSRTRYMQDSLGPDGYRAAYREKLSAALADETLKRSITAEPVTKKGDGSLSHPRAIPQKQPGLYAVSYHPIGGNPTPEKFLALYQAIAPMESVEIRLAPDEGMYLINCTADEAKSLIALTDDGADTLFESSTACIGNHICQLGLRDSQSLLKACVDAIRPFHFADGILPKLHISGCPSSCGTHQAAALGFRGAVKQSPDGPKAAYALFEGGCAELGSEAFGTEIGIMEETNIPAFLIALGQEVQKSHSSYAAWIPQHHETLLSLANQYCNA